LQPLVGCKEATLSGIKVLVLLIPMTCQMVQLPKSAVGGYQLLWDLTIAEFIYWDPQLVPPLPQPTLTADGPTTNVMPAPFHGSKLQIDLTFVGFYLMRCFHLLILKRSTTKKYTPSALC
jgi:hypothetical protein